MGCKGCTRDLRFMLLGSDTAELRDTALAGGFVLAMRWWKSCPRSWRNKPLTCQRLVQKALNQRWDQHVADQHVVLLGKWVGVKGLKKTHTHTHKVRDVSWKPEASCRYPNRSISNGGNLCRWQRREWESRQLLNLHFQQFSAWLVLVSLYASGPVQIHAHHMEIIISRRCMSCHVCL